MGNSNHRSSEDIRRDIDQTLASIKQFRQRNTDLESLMADKWDADTSTEESEYAALSGKLKAADVRINRLNGELHQALIAEFTARWLILAKSAGVKQQTYQESVQVFNQAVEIAHRREQEMKDAYAAFSYHLNNMYAEYSQSAPQLGVAPLADFVRLLSEYVDLGGSGVPPSLKHHIEQ